MSEHPLVGVARNLYQALKDKQSRDRKKAIIKAAVDAGLRRDDAEHIARMVECGADPGIGMKAWSKESREQMLDCNC
jgi:hypothetical protein